MKRVFDILKRTPVLIILFIIIFLYMPVTLTYVPETERNAIVSAVGVDKSEDGYEMSFLCFIPQANSSYQEKLEVLSSSGKTITDNLRIASKVLGKNVNLNHVETIVLSKEIMDDSIINALDFFARAPVILSGCIVAGTNGKARDVIEAVQKLNTKSGTKIEDVLRFTESSFYGRETSVDSFYQGYYSPTSTSCLSYIEMLEQDVDGLSPSSEEGAAGSSSAQGSSGAGGEKNSGTESQGKGQKVLSNLGKMVLTKSGKQVAILDEEVVSDLNYIKTGVVKNLIKLENIEFQGIKNVDVTYQVTNNSVISYVDFQNGIPLIKIKSRIKVALYEVLDDTGREKQTFEQNKLNEYVSSEIEKYVKTKFNRCIQILRENKTDVLNIYDKFMAKDRTNFEKFLSNLEEKDDYLSHIVFALTVESEPV